jgi:soluble lytic murein transglycosylase-like protein
MKLTESIAWGCAAWRATKRGTHGGLAAFGFFVLVFLALEGGAVLPGEAAQASEMALAATHAEAVSAEPVTADAEARPDPRQRTVAAYLARKYRVALDATERLVGNAHAAATETGVDPFLILAVMAIESNLNPIAESHYGAKGLMQVVPRFHLEKVTSRGGPEALLDPHVNIRVGAEILREYIGRMGSLEAGLQLYAGAVDDAERSYARKVLAEMQRLKDAAARPPAADAQA